jgi:D-glycero-D-manno-heptose 1,7-bisphosphate phosphatase
MDRDGTVSEEIGYMYHAALFRPFPWTGEAIRRINQSGMKAILVTNQSGVGRGFFSEDTVSEVHTALKAELARSNAYLDAIYYCPHLPEAGCECRKPNSGMLVQAEDEFGIDLKQSYVIGDRFLDIRMAHNVGARGVLVLTGDGRAEMESHQNDAIQPDIVSATLLTAVETILGGPCLHG